MFRTHGCLTLTLTMRNTHKLTLTTLVLGLAASTAFASSATTLQTQIAQANGLTLPQETLTAQLTVQPLLDAQNQVVTQQALQSLLQLEQFNSLESSKLKLKFPPHGPVHDQDRDAKHPRKDKNKDLDRADQQPRQDKDLKRDDKQAPKSKGKNIDRDDKQPRQDRERDAKPPRQDRDEQQPHQERERGETPSRQDRPNSDEPPRTPHPQSKPQSLATGILKHSNAFLCTSGIASSNGDTDAYAQLVTAGYNLALPRYHTNVTLFADAQLGKTTTSSATRDLTTKAHTGYGVGALASFHQRGFTLSGLASYNWGKTTVNGTTDYTSLINQLTDSTLKDQLASSAKSTLDSQAATRTTNFLVKAAYNFNVGRGVTLTPSLTYQYQHFAPQDATTTSTNAATQAQAASTPAIPALTTHGIGAGVDLSYRVNPRLVVGADAQVMKYQTTLAQPQVATNTTTNQVSTTSVDTQLKYLNYNTNLKASYNITPRVTVSAQVGYSYTTELEQSGVNYGVGVSYRF